MSIKIWVPCRLGTFENHWITVPVILLVKKQKKTLIRMSFISLVPFVSKYDRYHKWNAIEYKASYDYLWIIYNF